MYMKYCVYPYCQKPQNPDTVNFCQSCGSGLRLKNRFSPIEIIGQGGFGRTFKAIDEDKLNQAICLVKQLYVDNNTTARTGKINLNSQTIVPGHQAINKLPDIYRTEVNQLAKLKHPQIPDFITSFEQDGYAYIVQEFIDGVNLEVELNRHGAFSEAKIWQLLNDLLPVIKFIHEQNVIHRDIKPENIIRPIENKPLVLVDFGAAKLVAPRPDTGTVISRGTAIVGTALGTPNYMAPEQQKGREVYGSDLYSLGVTCIRLMTNTLPQQLFDDGTNSWEWESHCKVSEKLAKILNKLLQLGTKNRYASADEVLKDIDLLRKQGKSQTNNIRVNPKKTTTTLWSKITALGTGAQGFAALVTLAISIGLIQALNGYTTKDAINKIPISSEKGIDYGKLRESLRQKDWKTADTETYELILKIAGEKSQSRGYINYDETNKLFCTDLKTIDQLWRASSDGKLGFSAQQLIYEQQGKSWQKMYSQIRWGKLTGTNVEKTVEQQFDWQTRRMRYKDGMEPDFKNPLPGHLPVTMSLVQGVAFPQFAEICKF